MCVVRPPQHIGGVVFSFAHFILTCVQLPQNLDRKRNGQYCLACFSECVTRVYKESLTFYSCSACGKTLERSLVIDDQIVWWQADDGTYWHESVGVVVVVRDTMLVLMRQIFPFSYTIPAGHLDIGESIETAARRELLEETGIVASDLELVVNSFDMSGDSCRRGSDHHRWHLYRARFDEYLEVQTNDEISYHKWMTLSELQTEKNLTFPLRYFIDALGEKLF